MSREEKKSRLMRLYSADAHAADSLLRVSEAALEGRRAAPRPSSAGADGLMEIVVPRDVSKIGFSVKPVPPRLPVVSEVLPGSLAEAQGLSVGQRLLAVGDRPTEGMPRGTFFDAMEK